MEKRANAPHAGAAPERVTVQAAQSAEGEPRAVFPGFTQPTSNATYCPNQFLDVVLPHFSRGVVRLVGYIVYRTFAWSDRDGRPVNEQHQVSYQELINRAGISRGAIRQAVDEAVAAKLVRVVRRGQAGRVGAAGEAHVLELNWYAGEYTRDPTAFRGFFEGAGHRTYIPNQFFTDLLPNEPLSVLKVVGAVIRFSIGFEVKRGFRRQPAALSYSAIQRYSRIGSREDLSRSLKHAVHCNYIQRVEAGAFDPDAGRLSRPASYGLQWADSQPVAREQSKTRTEAVQAAGSSEPKAVPDEASNSRTGAESNSRTGGGPVTEPAHRSRTRTGLEMHLSVGSRVIDHPLGK
jgi:hypothetical protein